MAKVSSEEMYVKQAFQIESKQKGSPIFIVVLSCSKRCDLCICYGRHLLVYNEMDRRSRRRTAVLKLQPV